MLPGTTRASLNGEAARANQRGAEAELVAAQGDADRADIDAAAVQTELDMAQQAAGDADAAVATAQAKSDAAAARDASAAAVARLRGINLAEAIANGSSDDVDEALNPKIAAAHDAAERAAAAKAELDAATVATDAVAPAYLEALANYTAAKAELDQAIVELNAEIARQEAAERGNGEQAQPATQVTYQAKHAVATTEAATWQTTMPGTGDMSDLLGETFVIGGTVLVAAGVFLSDKRRQLTR